jgi:hypothetical protein
MTLHGQLTSIDNCVSVTQFLWEIVIITGIAAVAWLLALVFLSVCFSLLSQSFARAKARYVQARRRAYYGEGRSDSRG